MSELSASIRPGVPGVPDWYVDCFGTALRRVAVVLNSDVPYDKCAGTSLRVDDDELDALFANKAWGRDLVQFQVAHDDDPHSRDDEYNAEYFFYCDVNFPSRAAGGARVRVARFVVPTTFLQWGYKRLHRPVGSAAQLGLDEFGGDIEAPKFVRHCATNYLVKNFWHNFVHRAIQGITTENYHRFGGPAREDSDFEADNISNILLVRSYGLPIHSRASIGVKAASSIESLFRRNRCNLIFAERAQHRKTDRAAMSLDERWGEMEWRFCRAVANSLSMRLITKGLAVPSLRVFFNGQVRLRGDDLRRRWRDGTVIVEIAGRRFDTGRPPYLPNDELRGQEIQSSEGETQARLDQIRERRAAREAEIVQVAAAAFERVIRDDRCLRDGVAASMTALSQRIAVAPLA